MSTSHDEYYRGVEAATKWLAQADEASASGRAALVHEQATELLAPSPDLPPPACRDGCSHCCHFPVGVTFAEAMRLVDAVAADRSMRERVLDEAAATTDHDWQALIARPCPLLHDHRCSAYANRPTPCRALASADEQACEDSLSGQTAAPRDERAYWRGIGVTAALAHGRPGSSEPTGCRELRSAVAAILQQPHDPQRAFLAARTTSTD